MIDRILNHTALDSRDSHLITALVYGVLRRQRYLDAILSHFSSHPLNKMKDFTLQALRVGAYQLLCLDRIPPSAAVNETVKAIRTDRKPRWLVNFVNGVLRALARQGYNPELWGENGWSSAVKLSHPDWLYNRYLKRYGEKQARAICEVNNRKPCLSLCLNTSVIKRVDFIELLRTRGIKAIPGFYLRETVILPEYSGTVNRLPGYRRGWFIVQDEGAQLITRMLAPLPPGTYLDACAGVGGKTIQLSLILPPGGRLTATEPNRKRFALLQENLDRMNLTPVVNKNHTTLKNFREQSEISYGNILLDAPCSGSGVIRRHPDIRWNLNGDDDLKAYQATQLALLNEASGLLATRGVLVYGTCSTEPEENEEVIEKFLDSNKMFSIERPMLSESCQQLLDDRGFLRLLPEEYHDGFFAARLVKDSEQ